jgi:hypothetical protein
LRPTNAATPTGSPLCIAMDPTITMEPHPAPIVLARHHMRPRTPAEAGRAGLPIIEQAPRTRPSNSVMASINSCLAGSLAYRPGVASSSPVV